MKQKNKKPVKISNIILNALCVAIFIFVAYELILKFTNNSIYLFGIRSDVVLSESMSYKNKDQDIQKFLEGHDDQLQKGDLVYSEKVTKKTELKIYDIVLFKNKDSNLITIHRIVEIRDGKEYLDGQTRYVIRADTANYYSTDGAYLKSEILARYKTKIPWVGHIHTFLTSIFGVILEVGVAVIILVYEFLDDKYFKKKTIEENTNTSESVAEIEEAKDIKDEKNE